MSDFAYQTLRFSITFKIKIFFLIQVVVFKMLVLLSLQIGIRGPALAICGVESAIC